MKDALKRLTVHPLHEDIKVYAVTYFLSRGKEIGSEELRRFAERLMNAIASECNKRGAKVIGHIKAYLEHETGFLHANTVGESSDVTVSGRDGQPVKSFRLVVNTIVYGLGEGAVKDATEEAIEATAALFGLKKEFDSRGMTINPI